MAKVAPLAILNGTLVLFPNVFALSSVMTPVPRTTTPPVVPISVAGHSDETVRVADPALYSSVPAAP